MQGLERDVPDAAVFLLRLSSASDTESISVGSTSGDGVLPMDADPGAGACGSIISGELVVSGGGSVPKWPAE